MAKLLACVVVAVFALPVFADPTAAPAPETTATAVPTVKSKPCKPVIDACKAAGFKGRKLFKGCVKPLKNGKTVEGVTVDPADLQACKEAKHGHHHGKRHGKAHKTEGNID